jgi:hypothetical protein
VLAFQWAAVSYLDRDFHRHAAALKPLMEQGGEFTICRCLNQLRNLSG